MKNTRILQAVMAFGGIYLVSHVSWVLGVAMFLVGAVLEGKSNSRVHEEQQ